MIDAFLNQTVPDLLTGKSLVIFAAVYLAGILTSLSPCILSMIPVLLGIIGGYSQPSKGKAFLLSLWFVLGLACTFAVLGLLAALLGMVFGSVGKTWYYLAGGISILMGLNLMEILPLSLPGISLAPPKIRGCRGAFIAGMFFGVVASPCATPVLVAILAMVSAAGSLVKGILLLFIYGLGHGLPLLILGSFAGVMKEYTLLRKWTKNINYFSGGLLILAGLYFIYIIT